MCLYTVYCCIKNHWYCYLKVSEADGWVDQKTMNTLDEFTQILNQDDATNLVDILKLAVAGRIGPNAIQAITTVLIGMYILFILSWDQVHIYFG